MVRKSYGIKRGTRKKLKKRRKDSININRFMQRFRNGDIVHIDIYPSLQKFPHPKFHGKTGCVIGKRGNAYIVEVRDLNAKKHVIVKPEYLQLHKSPST
ncbi:MAG: 50S ribosomal protein L21e [Candidatus Aenigmarchaeota archaeon]|nr:50S ribosomal protein L21e [Candidatus Aenigmarchaeota archaeon]